MAEYRQSRSELGGNVSDEDVANDPSRQCRGQGQHHQAKQVEIALGRGLCALDAEEQRSGQVSCE